MKTLRNIAFVVEDFALQTPAQQLLDRFLIGYPRDGEFHRLQDCRVTVCGGGKLPELERRANDFGLTLESDLPKAVAGADAIVVVPKGSGATPNEGRIQAALENAPPECASFVYGTLAGSLSAARRMVELARTRRIALLAGTTLPVTWRLPEVELKSGTPLSDALMVVQGESWTAELDGLEGLLPIIERRRGGESGVRAVQLLSGGEVWQAGERGRWSWPLLSAALSRSDSPQGNALKDGRTEDLVGLSMVTRLAREPKGWLIEHSDGLRSAILRLDGVVADYNFAVQAQDGTVTSAQIYRPPAPAEHHFSRLAAVLEEYFRTGQSPWPLSRNELIAGLLEVFRKAANSPGSRLETPELRTLAYS